MIELSYLYRIGLSLVLSMLVGLEREHEDKPAGLRTCMLVCFSMTMLMILNFQLFKFSAQTVDLARIPSYSIASIGFLGSGVIIFTRKKLEGITTASVLLALVATGLLCGMGEYILASITALVVLGILKLKHIEIIIREIIIKRSKQQ